MSIGEQMVLGFSLAFGFSGIVIGWVMFPRWPVAARCPLTTHPERPLIVSVALLAPWVVLLPLALVVAVVVRLGQPSVRKVEP